jgi:hypothetical protein
MHVKICAVRVHKAAVSPVKEVRVPVYGYAVLLQAATAVGCRVLLYRASATK